MVKIFYGQTAHGWSPETWRTSKHLNLPQVMVVNAKKMLIKLQEQGKRVTYLNVNN